MNLVSHRLSCMTATLALFAALAVAVAPAALADDWGRDRAQVAALSELDPAIRTAVAAQESAPLPVVPPAASPVAPSSPSDGFAWGAAGLGLLVGVSAMCVALACVTLLRHDGRLRSA
jgi:hypothetical protein